MNAFTDLAARVADLEARVERLEPKRRQMRSADLKLFELLCDWVRPFGREFLVAEVDDALDVEGPLRDAVVAVIGERRKGRVIRIGKWFESAQGREINGLQIVRRGDHHGVARWRFERVQGLG